MFYEVQEEGEQRTGRVGTKDEVNVQSLNIHTGKDKK